MTLAVGEDNAFKLFKDCSALMCCIVPKIALIQITISITKVLSSFPRKADIIAAKINIITKKSLNCSRKT
ncbi:hypothetical protein SDC9_178409 [bioreactor metagenome]|uniref:Uncharacterized protein n=1 Tax=bioreactor metagenome TaxID=1076179 RepID=A0A645GVU1_9ZZZZ